MSKVDYRNKVSSTYSRGLTRVSYLEKSRA